MIGNRYEEYSAIRKINTVQYVYNHVIFRCQEEAKNQELSSLGISPSKKTKTQEL